MKLNSFRMSCLAVVAMLVFASACKGATDGLPVRNTGHYAIIDTERGTIVLELYPESAPKTVANFETLVNKGFYNGLTWHRVVPDFVIQGGDPDGTGAGGPGYTVPAEIKEKHLRGSLATARQGDEVNPTRASSGSQFYICLQPQPGLDGQYTVFGGVIKGMDAVDQIQKGDHMKKITLAKEPPK
ncbi:MAG: peptidylprolyl isomerase [Candidatus Binatus sp.]|uniref:peptidylprolyl isomerase n=1 Tax=Candidatus Binatus sp. TaxID=2811406 RepID=UPI003BB0BE91